MSNESAPRVIHGQTVRGQDVDAETRCAHWHGPSDVIALRMKCCGEWYPCYECHDADAGHAREVWPLAERDATAILCGVCGAMLSIETYVGCGSRCPSCAAAFNPGCALHYDLYFERD